MVEEETAAEETKSDAEEEEEAKKRSEAAKKAAATRKRNAAKTKGRNLEEEEEYANHEDRIRGLTRRVLQGEFGFGDARKEALGNAHDEVMKRVVEIRTGKQEL